MFKELAPLLRQRSVLITATRLEDDAIRVTVIPKKLKDGENQALTTPVSVTGTGDELDTQLPSALSEFVGAHLALKNTIETAKAEMDAAAKTAKAEARSKTHAKGATTTTAGVSAKKDDNPTDKEPAKAVAEKKPAAARTPSLFDAPSSPSPAPVAVPANQPDEDDAEILAEIAEEERHEEETEAQAEAA